MELNKKFIHIHPGYLPEIKGADGSLWHINKHNNIGISSFFMSKKIDEGLVIAKEKFEEGLDAVVQKKNTTKVN